MSFDHVRDLTGEVCFGASRMWQRWQLGAEGDRNFVAVYPVDVAARVGVRLGRQIQITHGDCFTLIASVLRDERI